jgi:hypothetical protein
MGRVSTYTNYRQVVDDPHCQEVLTWAAADADAQMSGEEFLKTAGQIVAIPITALSTIAGVPIPFSGKTFSVISTTAGRASAALGVKTGKTQTHVVAQPYGYVLLAVLTFLAANAMPLTDVAETNGQCVIKAVLPSNPLTWKGHVFVTLRAEGQRVYVEAATKVPGQVYDWGRSRRMLGNLFQTVEARAASFQERDL